MKRTTLTPPLQSVAATVAAWIHKLEARGEETCVLTWPEFEALIKVMPVVAENREIFRDLGVLGYVGSVTVFHAESWAAKPLKFRDYDSRF